VVDLVVFLAVVMDLVAVVEDLADSVEEALVGVDQVEAGKLSGKLKAESRKLKKE
jgi:hypothetical protein